MSHELDKASVPIFQKPVASPVGHIVSAKLEVVDGSLKPPCRFQKDDASWCAEERFLSVRSRVVQSGSATSSGFTPTETQTGPRQAESAWRYGGTSEERLNAGRFKRTSRLKK